MSKDITEKDLNRVAGYLEQSYLTNQDIHTRLLQDGFSEYQAFLIYQGAKMIAKTRRELFLAEQARRMKPTVKLGAVKL